MSFTMKENNKIRASTMKENNKSRASVAFLNQFNIKAIAPLHTPSLNTAGNTASTNLVLRLKV